MSDTKIEYVLIIEKSDFDLIDEKTKSIIRESIQGNFDVVYEEKIFTEKTKETVLLHYVKNDTWKEKIGGFVRKDIEKLQITQNTNVEKYSNTPNLELGQLVYNNLVEYLQEPSRVIILKGKNALAVCRETVENERKRMTTDINDPEKTIESCLEANRNLMHCTNKDDGDLQSPEEILNFVPNIHEIDPDFKKYAFDCLHGKKDLTNLPNHLQKFYFFNFPKENFIFSNAIKLNLIQDLPENPLVCEMISNGFFSDKSRN